MKKVLAILFLAAGFNAAKAQTFTIDTEKAIVSYNYYKHEVTGTVSGIKGEIVFDVSDLTKSVITGTAESKTITSGNDKRDEHLEAADYFNVAKYPQMSFKSTSITATETGYKMMGMLTIKDVSKEVEFNFTFNNNLFAGKAYIYTNDFGIAVEKKREDSKVSVKVSIPVM